MKQLLCCMINPAAACRCGFQACTECAVKAHGCKLKKRRKGYSWGIATVYIGKKGSGEIKEVIALIPKKVGRMWSFGNVSGDNIKGWVPRPTSFSAKWLKVIEVKGKLPRKSFHDSSMVTNLSTKKAGYVKRVGDGFVLTSKGKKYLATHKVEVDVEWWMAKKTAAIYKRAPKRVHMSPCCGAPVRKMHCTVCKTDLTGV